MEHFTIFKNSYKEEGSNQPDYTVSVKEGDSFKTWGACWIKDGAKGKYFSCSKSKDKDEDSVSTPSMNDPLA